MQDNSNLLKALTIILAVKPEKKATEPTEKSYETTSPSANLTVDQTGPLAGPTFIITGVAPPKKSAR